MAVSGSDEDDEEQLSSDDDDGSSNSSDGSDGSASSSGDDNDDDSGDEEDEDDDDDAKGHELKQAQVRSDIYEMRLMVGEMEKIKQRLLFRLDREKHAKLEDAKWQQRQQQLADEERQRQQQQLAKEEEELKRQQHEDADKKAREEETVAQEAALLAVHKQQQPLLLSERSFVEIGIQTEASTTTAKRDDRMHSNVAQEGHCSTHDLSQDRQSASPSQQASGAMEGQSARLSLYDLGKSYGLIETAAPKQEANRQDCSHRSVRAPSPATAPRNAPTPPSDASDGDTFFIRRDSNRTSWQPNAPDHNSSFQRSQGSVLDSEYGENEHLESPPQVGSRTNRSAFEALRNSILSSIHEGGSAVSSAASAASSKLFAARRGRMGLVTSSAAHGDGESATKTDEQREQEAIESLLFSR